MDFDQEKNEKFLGLVQKHQARFDEMDYEFYDLDTPSLDGKIEQATFVFEVLEMNHLLDENTQVSDIQEYLPGLFKNDIIDGFTFLRNQVPYYISLTDKKPEGDYQVISFGRTTNPELIEKENELIEVYELFQKGNSIRKLHHW